MSDTFSTIKNITVPISRSNIILVFFKAACYASPGAEKHEEDQAHILQDTYSKSC